MATPIALQSGFVLEIKEKNRIGDNTYYALIIENNQGNLGVSSPDLWCNVNKFDDNFEYGNYKVIKVYGRAFNCNSYKLGKEDRQLLWERVEPKEITVEEIEKILGYKIKVIGGK